MQTSAMELVLFREEAVDDRLQQQHGGAVVKRKRTKRPRHHPPVAAMAACSSASSSESTTTEEEDMAHCLILLAQGAAPPVVFDSRPSPPATALVLREGSLPPPAGPAPASVVVATKTERYTSRKYTEAATTADGVRAGFYVYECKTCNKCFPTFQALGGHRASHKKPRIAGAADDENATAIAKPSKPPTMKTASPPRPMMTLTASPPPPPPQADAALDVTTVLSLNNNVTADAGINNNNRIRVHECSICGAEFASGQALGGHMRRHRPLHAPADRATATPVTAITASATTKKDIINLELDLNMPAPSDEESVSHPPPPPPATTPVVLGLGPFDSGKKRLMLTAAASPALVDCHY
ncbi:unnamed protein product [Alopecurus aequalis]